MGNFSPALSKAQNSELDSSVWSWPSSGFSLLSISKLTCLHDIQKARLYGFISPEVWDTKDLQHT